MVDMPHDGNHRGPGNEILLPVYLLIDEAFHFGGDILHFEPVLLGEKACRIGIEELVHRGGHSHLNQPLDHFACLDPHPVGQISDSNDLLDLEHALAGFRRQAGRSPLLPYGPSPSPFLDADRLELAHHRRFDRRGLLGYRGALRLVDDFLDDVLLQHPLLHLFLVRLGLLPFLFLLFPLLVGLRRRRGLHDADFGVRHLFLHLRQDLRLRRDRGHFFLHFGGRRRRLLRCRCFLVGRGRRFRFGCASPQHHPSRLALERPVLSRYLERRFHGRGRRRPFPEMAPHLLNQVPLDVTRRGFPLQTSALQEQQDLLAALHPEFLGKLPYANLLHLLPLQVILIPHDARGPPRRQLPRRKPAVRTILEERASAFQAPSPKTSRASASDAAEPPIRKRLSPFGVRILRANSPMQPVPRQR